MGSLQALVGGYLAEEAGVESLNMWLSECLRLNRCVCRGKLAFLDLDCSRELRLVSREQVVAAWRFSESQAFVSTTRSSSWWIHSAGTESKRAQLLLRHRTSP